MERIRLFAVVILVSVTLFSIQAIVTASGSAGTGGSYSNGAMTKYVNPRTVTDPSLPGPEVAFYLSTYSPGLYMGTWNCDYGYDGPLYLKLQYYWTAVAYYSSPREFCVVTWGVDYSGSFTGTIAWD